MTDLIHSSIASYEAGDCTRLAVYMDLLYLTPKMGVQQVLDCLPPEWKRGFADWLVETYDNEMPVEAYLSIGLSEEELNMKPDPISLVRGWLKTRR